MKQLSICLWVLLLVPFSQAFLSVEPQSVDLTVYQDTVNNIEVTLQNHYNFTIYNVSFSGLPFLTTPYIPMMLSNETTRINLTIVTNNVFSKTHNISTIKFLYSSSVFIPQVTYNVTINQDGYKPQSITIKERDSIIWINNDSLPHTITTSDYDYTIQPNMSKTLQFTENKSIDYHDVNIGFHGYITVNKANDELLHNNDYDRTFNLDLTSKHKETSISLELVETAFTINVGSENEGLLKVKNIGNKTALMINLSSSIGWITFRKNNFSLEPEQINYVNYLISPSNLLLADTNKTHSILITAYGENFATITGTLSVTIPFAEDLTTINTTADWWTEKKKFCDANPRSQLCMSDPITQEVEKVVYREEVYPVNVTGKEIMELNRRLTSIDTVLGVSSKYSTEKSDSIDVRLSKLESISSMLTSISNESLSRTLDNEDRTDAILLGFILVIIFILLAGAGGVAIYMNYKLKKKEMMNQ